VRPLVTMTGEAHFNEVFFTDVRVPADQIVGRRGDGWKVANVLLLHERDDLGDPDATLTRFHALVEMMKSEAVDGLRLIDNPVYRDRLMQIQGRVMAMRANHLRLLSAKLNGKDAHLAALIVKLQGTELRHQLEGLAIDALGELGILYKGSPHLRDEGSWQSMYMLYLGLIIGGGTAQIQKNIISERGLGMPREPKVTK
jgi:alkylation response protein AidB-like acyl-CoA dehydrogenase